MLAFSRTGSVLKPEGELTIFEAAEACRRLREELDAGGDLQLDLSAVAELDTAGVQVLLWLKREARSRGSAVPFAHHSPAVLEVFDRLNLAGVFGDILVIAPSA
ncbi:MAG TPA: STAS domain-containing protein [Holophaga sp.]|nr:STAS domain-containing protein [Holophaga sp.]